MGHLAHLFDAKAELLGLLRRPPRNNEPRAEARDQTHGSSSGERAHKPAKRSVQLSRLGGVLLARQEPARATAGDLGRLHATGTSRRPTPERLAGVALTVGWPEQVAGSPPYERDSQEEHDEGEAFKNVVALRKPLFESSDYRVDVFLSNLEQFILVNDVVTVECSAPADTTTTTTTTVPADPADVGAVVAEPDFTG